MIYLSRILAIMLTTLVATSALAESTSTENDSSAAQNNRPILFAGEKLWVATWDMSMADIILLPPATAKSVHYSSVSKTEIIPITSVGFKLQDVSLSFSTTAKNRFNSTDNAATNVDRSEWDIALGYSLLPNLTASIAYKGAKISKVTTDFASTVLGGTTGYKIQGLLFGIGGNAIIQNNISLYGHTAFGPAKQKVDGGTLLGSPTYHGNYKVGEIGLSYKFANFGNANVIKNMSAQLGYRIQVVTLKDLDFGTFAIPGGATITNQKSSVKSSTDGYVIGISAAF